MKNLKKVMSHKLLVSSGGGFSVIELLIVLGIMAILAGGTSFLYSGFLENRYLVDEANKIVSALRNAQVRAASGENNQLWGIGFKNSDNDYYQLFNNSPPSTTIISNSYLSSRVQFSDPAYGSTKSIIFSPITGRPSADSSYSVTIQLVSKPEIAKTISVSSLGVVSMADVIIAAPAVVSANPNNRGSGAQSQSLTVIGSDFSTGASVSFSGSGISVNSTTFVSSTQLAVNINIDESAAVGTRDVSAVNPGSQSGTCAACFTVNAGPATVSVSPNSLEQGSSAQNVVITGLRFASGASASFSGGGITVHNTTFQSSTQVTANISLDLNTPTTTRDITVTNSTDAGAGTGAGIFSVSAMAASIVLDTFGAGTNASGGGSCEAAYAWTDTEICVKVPVGVSAGSASTTVRSSNYDSNLKSFTVQ